MVLMVYLALTGSTGAPSIALQQTLCRHEAGPDQFFILLFAMGMHTPYPIRHSSMIMEIRLLGGIRHLMRLRYSSLKRYITVNRHVMP